MNDLKISCRLVSDWIEWGFVNSYQQKGKGPQHGFAG